MDLMHRQRRAARALLMLAPLAAGFVACGAPAEKTSASPYAPAPDPAAGPPVEVVQARRPWTTEFVTPALLIASEVRVEGPVGLLDHVATRADPDVHERVEKTTPLGFLQQITLKPEVGEAEIQGHLDALRIVATRRLVVLERSGPQGEVRVSASGDAYWREDASGKERRGPTLGFVGKIER